MRFLHHALGSHPTCPNQAEGKVTPLCLRSLQIQPDLLVATSITIIQCNPTFSPSSTSKKKRSPSSSTFLQLVSNDFSAHVLPPMSLFYLDDLMTLLSNYTVSQNSFSPVIVSFDQVPGRSKNNNPHDAATGDGS